MKIEIRRFDSRVDVFLGPTPSTQFEERDKHRYFVFCCPTSDDDYAELMVSYLRDGLMEFLRSEREQYYNRGWADKSAHRSKRKWFPNALRVVAP